MKLVVGRSDMGIDMTAIISHRTPMKLLPASRLFLDNSRSLATSRLCNLPQAKSL